MADKRSNGQKIVTVWMKESLLGEIEAQRPGDRSQFIRDACLELLQRLGIPIDDSEAAPPDRAGKGGPRRP